MKQLLIASILCLFAIGAQAQNTILNPVGVGFGGSVAISPGGFGPAVEQANDPFSATITITPGTLADGHSGLTTLSVFFEMYYLRLIGSPAPGTRWRCTYSLTQGPGIPDGTFEAFTPWPVGTWVYLIDAFSGMSVPVPYGQGNVFGLEFSAPAGGQFVPFGSLSLSFSCPPKWGQYP